MHQQSLKTARKSKEEMAFIKWFKDVSEKDSEVGSNVHLALLANASFPVPAGFIVTIDAYKTLKREGHRMSFPDNLAESITDSYQLLGVANKTKAEAIMQGTEEIVTVRCDDAPFHVQGSQNVLKAIAACWAKESKPVLVQRMIQSEKAGIMSTTNPANKSDELVILAAYGLGEAVTSGAVKPDTYIVDKKTLNVREAKVKEQDFRLFLDKKTGKLLKEKLSEGDRRLQVLTDKEIYQIARYGRKIQEHLNIPVNVEWALENDQVHILRCQTSGKEEKKSEEKKVESAQREEVKPSKKEKTTTNVHVLLDLAGQNVQAERALIQPELIIASSNTHPAHFIREKRADEYTKHLVNEIKKMGTIGTLWLCNSDMRSDEYRTLKGGHKESYEADPLIGWHGVRRLLDEPEILKAEYAAVKKLLEQGYNVGIVLPFVSDKEEVRKAKEVLKDVNIGVMIETPASCAAIADICKEGVSFACMNIESIAQLVLGIDKHNPKVKKHFNLMHPAVLSLIETAIKGCKAHGVEIAACGNMPMQMAQFLASHGADIYAKPEAVQKMRNAITAP